MDGQTEIWVNKKKVLPVHVGDDTQEHFHTYAEARNVIVNGAALKESDDTVLDS